MLKKDSTFFETRGFVLSTALLRRHDAHPERYPSFLASFGVA
jgi:hypothetical protein